MESLYRTNPILKSEFVRVSQFEFKEGLEKLKFSDSLFDVCAQSAPVGAAHSHPIYSFSTSASLRPVIAQIYAVW